MSNLKSLSPAEWERIESDEHDAEYRDSRPFDSANFKIDPPHVIWWQDYCYLPGRRADRGHRTKRVFEMMDLDSLKGKTILDVGCGNGQYSVFFAMMGARVCAFDLSPVGVEIGKRIASENGVADRCSFSVQNASAMDYPSDHFDIVVFHEVLHHAIKYPGVREETLRVLKKGGLMICAETLEGNPLLSLGRAISMRGQERKGDVILTLRDLDEFSQGFETKQLELMSLLFMAKRTLKSYVRFAPVRWLLFALKKTDDVLLSAFPSLQRYCGECVLVLKK